MTALHLLRSYWDWAGANVAALPLEAAATAAGAWVFRKPLRRLADWAKRQLLSGVHQHLDEIHESARAAHKIAADTHWHVTGEKHPDAPRGSL